MPARQMSEAMEPGVLLDVLGNENRRRILRLLADEPKYFNQLAKELGVSQQAVLKHLDILEQHGLVASFRAKSELAGPDRKYFKLGRGLHLSVGIAAGLVDMDLQELGEAEKIRGPRQLLDTYHEVKNLDEIDDGAELVSASDRILREIDKRVRTLDEEKISFLNLRQIVMEKVHQVAQASFVEELERRLLYSVLGSERTIDVEELSQELDARERQIKEAITGLRRKFALRLLSG